MGKQKHTANFDWNSAIQQLGTLSKANPHTFTGVTIKDRILKLCGVITGSSSETTIKGEIESLAFELEHEVKLGGLTPWLEFPYHIPDQDGYYLTTIMFDGVRMVIENKWNAHSKQWGNSHYIVRAFMDKPEPYQGELTSTLQTGEDK